VSNLQFVYTSEHDMHVHQWLHHVAAKLMRAASRCDAYDDRRKAVINGMQEFPLCPSNRRYVGDCALSLLGHGGGL
jgi:hypothetical protein